MKNGVEIFDFVIVGSGFGGSVSAYRLAQKGYRVLVLERGKRYDAEDFPKTNWNLPNFLWLPSARFFGFFHISFLKDIMILSGSGVGGGSLVYASTHIKPPQEFFQGEEWRDLADWETELSPFYETANRMLGTAKNPRLWPADQRLNEIAQDLGREETFDATPVGIFFGEPGEMVPDPYFDGQGPDRAGCIHCGGCMVGCRYHAKNTLDRNYLYLAEKLGTEVRAEANVLDIRPLYGPNPGAARYEVEYEKITDWVFKKRVKVRARNVVVSAGTLGTLNLLLKCRDETKSLPLLSQSLARRVRSNSEAIMGVTSRDDKVQYSEGVAISSHFWADEVTSVEPVRYPPGSSFIKAISLPLVDFAGSPAKRLGTLVLGALTRPKDFYDYWIKSRWSERTTIILIMQTLENRMKMKRGRGIWNFFKKGLISERDETLPIPPVIDAGRKIIKDFASRTGGIPVVGVNDVLDIPLTAHILGGCAIGGDAATGVIDTNQEAFNYPGMYVADGSVIPANLGVNPSLTITAMTERAMSNIPAKKDTGPVLPLEQPSGLEYVQKDAGTNRSMLKKVAPFAFLAIFIPLLFGVFKLWKR